MGNGLKSIVKDAQEWAKSPLALKIGLVIAGVGAMDIILTCLSKIG